LPEPLSPEQAALFRAVADFEPLMRRTALGDDPEAREESYAQLRLHLLRKIAKYRPVHGVGLAAWMTTVCRRWRIDQIRKLRPASASLDGVDESAAACWHEFAETFDFDPVAVKKALRKDPELLRDRLQAFLDHHCRGAGRVPDLVQDLFDLVPAPHRDSVNTGLSPCSPRTLARLLGTPWHAQARLGKTCGKPTAEYAKRLVTADVGPFRVTGERLAVASLAKVFADVKRADAELYSSLGTAGMLCVRHVRGLPGVPSNHCWGTAVDLKIRGRLDPRGDGKTQLGLIEVYRHFRDHGWYWGVEFRTEDAMHFELAEETVRRMYA
jgi:hypothetical protein